MGVIVIVHMTMADLLRLDAAPFVVGSSILTETAGTLQIGIGQHLLRRAAGHDLARQQQRLIEPLARLRRIMHHGDDALPCCWHCRSSISSDCVV